MYVYIYIYALKKTCVYIYTYIYTKYVYIHIYIYIYIVTYNTKPRHFNQPGVGNRSAGQPFHQMELGRYNLQLAALKSHAESGVSTMFIR